MTGCSTDGKVFTSSDQKFTLNLPADWEEYDDEQENTFAFYNVKSWSGNLRVTPFYWDNDGGGKTDRGLEIVEEELGKHPEAKRQVIGGYDCAHYQTRVQEDDEDLIIYYWMVAISNHVVVCSFTINRDMEGSSRNRSELNVVEDILASMKMH